MTGPVDALARLDAPPVFVVGYERSGTTLLFEAIEAHPQAAGVFESWLFHERLGLGGLFDRAFWDEELTALQDRYIGRPMGLRALISREVLIEQVRALASGWLAQALGPEDRFLVEKTPVHLYAAPILAEMFPGARFVEIIRDGRDVIVSSRAASRGWGKQVGRVQTATNVGDMAREWRTSIEVGIAHQRALGDRWLRIRFEDLRADFPATLARVFDFCNFPCDADIIEGVRAATNLGRHATSEQGFRRGGRVGDWRNRLSVGDALRIDRAAGPALVASGYARRHVWTLSVVAARAGRLRSESAARG